MSIPTEHDESPEMTIPGERDKSLERWLRELRPNQPETKACLDAETAASWMAGSLSGDALQQAQTHLADCDRCQTLIGSLVRADVGGQPKPSAAERTWLRWLVPAAAGAAVIVAVGVWAVLPRQADDPVSTVAENTAAKEAATVQEPAPALTPADERAARTLAPPAPASGTAGTITPGVAPFARAQSQTAESLSPEIFTPDQVVRWRIGGRQVQRSLDRGASWAPIQVGAPAAFTAGSAPSRTVCWLVGRGGIVLLTTNGATFKRVPFPEPADLVAASAADGRSAMVTTADGRTFRTSDGGSTWTR